MEVTVENCHHSVILTEVKNGIELVNCEALTLAVGGSILPTLKVQDSREISVITVLDAMRNPLETHGSTGVTLFAVHDVQPGATPE